MLFKDSEVYNKEVEKFYDKRQLNHYVMSNTYSLCKTDVDLIKSIDFSIKNQKLYLTGYDFNVEKDGPTEDIVVSKDGSFKAARKYKGKKIAVLNFANNHKVGGSPWSAGAQEETLCRESTLFKCLEAMEEKYYKVHQDAFNQGKLDFMGNDDIIYTPEVCIFKSDESAPKLFNKEDIFKVDVITCAAPKIVSAVMLDQNYENIIDSRIEAILKSAKENNVEVLILGAFGCGAFRNPPEIVAKSFKKGLEKYHFEKVEFAVFCRYEFTNYEVFAEVFSK